MVIAFYLGKAVVVYRQVVVVVNFGQSIAVQLQMAVAANFFGAVVECQKLQAFWGVEPDLFLARFIFKAQFVEAVGLVALVCSTVRVFVLGQRGRGRC